ncbi:hypothetical protein P148_SR1C00001G0290 [candidate division SR1 bacterium RAAC1_SR1_1]|nr:hypothetical protein P148_SR1C00001G0290 [candidate division SR1 bacterium RAAC1_SR1_1]
MKGVKTLLSDGEDLYYRTNGPASVFISCMAYIYLLILIDVLAIRCWFESGHSVYLYSDISVYSGFGEFLFSYKYCISCKRDIRQKIKD